MIEVFRTDIVKRIQAQNLSLLLSQAFPSFKINFDLDDCDRVLRIEGPDIPIERIIQILTECGYRCEILT